VGVIANHHVLPFIRDDFQTLDTGGTDSLQGDRKLDDQAWSEGWVFISIRWCDPEALVFCGYVVDIETVLAIGLYFVPENPVHVVRTIEVPTPAKHICVAADLLKVLGPPGDQSSIETTRYMVVEALDLAFYNILVHPPGANKIQKNYYLGGFLSRYRVYHSSGPRTALLDEVQQVTVQPLDVLG
jgi:hypothetical protein